MRKIYVLGLVPWWVLFCAGVSGAADSQPASPPAFKILVEADGVYRVTYDDLAASGLELPSLPSDALDLHVGGEAVPIFVQDQGDGTFGPGDHFEFIGHRLSGEHSWVHDYAWSNVYRLQIGQVGSRMTAGQPAPVTEQAARARARRHLEEDKLLIRLPGIQGAEDDPWYWAKMVHNKPAPTRIALDLEGLDENGQVDLAVTVRGWSRPHNKAAPEIADHALAIKLANLETGRERVLGVESWNGTSQHRIELPGLAAKDFGAKAELRLMVPMRKEAKEGRALIDVLLLNSVELVYDHGPRVPPSGARLEWAGPAPARLDSADGIETLIAYGEGGSRSPGSSPHLDGEDSAWFVAPEYLRRPVAVIADTPSDLRQTNRQADYLMIAPRVFHHAVEPLANLHRGRGLQVALVDVENIYDEFNHGIAHPEAIRNFVAWTSEHWQAPAPRFVLLVGDASWDVKNAEAVDAHYADWTYRRGESRDFAKNESTPYEGATGRSRHFIPTWQTSTGQGHAASDNFFVDIAGDGAPELAIGRLPVASVEELEPIVRKIVRYVQEPAPGDWRRDVLFVTNEQTRYQNHSDRLATHLADGGFTPQKIYPASSEKSNEAHTEALVEALGDGQLVVHFIGHGGRYIWRTGPPDLEKNHDLFTLDDLDRLPPSERLPVIVSLTCYSAPFDHPTADSIGEKFLRLEDRGAIGVIAASWRNSPNYSWGQIILDHLTSPGATVGEALMAAKQEIRGHMFRETYLLLGDPAVPVALPADGSGLATDLASEGTNSAPEPAAGLR